MFVLSNGTWTWTVAGLVTSLVKLLWRDFSLQFSNCVLCRLTSNRFVSVTVFRWFRQFKCCDFTCWSLKRSVLDNADLLVSVRFLMYVFFIFYYHCLVNKSCILWWIKINIYFFSVSCNNNHHYFHRFGVAFTWFQRISLSRTAVFDRLKAQPVKMCSELYSERLCVDYRHRCYRPSIWLTHWDFLFTVCVGERRLGRGAWRIYVSYVWLVGLPLESYSQVYRHRPRNHGSHAARAPSLYRVKGHMLFAPTLFYC